MKEKLLVNDYEKQLLNQRNLIETVFDCLKHKYYNAPQKLDHKN